MAHNITNTDKMIYVGQVPWHGLGIELPNLATAEEAYQAAFGWYVKSEPVYIKQGDTYIPAGDEYRANVRSDTNTVLGIVSDQYRVVQPIEAFKFFDNVTQDPGGPKYVTAGSLGGGKKMWLLAKMPKHIEVTDKDKYEQYLFLYNSFNGSTGVQMMWTSVRVVCQNTVNMALNQANGNTFKMKHFANSFQVKKAQEFLGIIEQNELALKSFMQDLMNVPLTIDQATDFYSEIWPDAPFIKLPKQKAVGPVLKTLDLWEQPNDFAEFKGTAYFALNCLTDYVDHYSSFRSSETRMDNLMFGAKQEIKDRAFALAGEKWLA